MVKKTNDALDNHHNSSAKSPLHCALKSGASFAIIQFIVDTFAIEKGKIIDCDAKSPFHYATMHTTDKISKNW